LTYHREQVAAYCQTLAGRDAKRSRHAARKAWSRLARGHVTPHCLGRTPLMRLAAALGAIVRGVRGVRTLAAFGAALGAVGAACAARRATVTPRGAPTDPTVAGLLARGAALDARATGAAWRQAGLDAWREWRTGRVSIGVVLAGGWGCGRGLQCSVRTLATRPADTAALVAAGVLSEGDAAWIASLVTGWRDDGRPVVERDAGAAWAASRGAVSAAPVPDVLPAARGLRSITVRWHGIPEAPHGTPAPTGRPPSLAGARRDARACAVVAAACRYWAARDAAALAAEHKRRPARGRWHRSGGYSAR